MPLIHKPKALRRGHRVALVSPAGSCEPSKLEAGIGVLRQWGLSVDEPAKLEPLRYMAGSDRERAAALSHALGRSDIGAVLCTRGGYGSARMAPFVDLSGLTRHPKIFMGYSDVTLLLNRVAQQWSAVSFHGPMVASDLPILDDERREHLRRFLFGEPDWWRGNYEQAWRQGKAAGVLVGGCLSVLVTTLATEFEIETTGRVLFLEDVAEAPYAIDRMLVHLAQAGKLDDLAALVLGSFPAECVADHSLRDIVKEATAGSNYPIVFGVDAGHNSANVVLPLGCRVGVDTDKQSLDLLEDVFD